MNDEIDLAGIAELTARWDQQQAAYITHREQRFDIMLDALAMLFATDGRYRADGSGATVLDVACGPGSLAARVLDRFPAARVIGLDHDPVLLSIARASLSAHGERFTAVDADLAASGWQETLGVGHVDAAVSSTALHWLAPAELVDVHAVLGELIVADGLFLNADHLRYDERTQPFLHAAAAADDEHTQAAGRAAGAQTWDEWWADAAAHPVCAPHVDERRRRFADRPPMPPTGLGFHLESLRTARFREVGTLWQYHDDFVVLGRR